MSVEHITGNLLDFPNGINVITHCCNAKGVMGSGIALSIKEEFPAAYDVYKKQFDEKGLQLGTFTVAEVSGGKRIVNIIGQADFGCDRRQVDYEAIYVGLETLRDVLEDAYKQGRIYVLGIPYKMGCDRAGGNWIILKAIIDSLFESSPIKCVIVELKKKETNNINESKTS